MATDMDLGLDPEGRGVVRMGGRMLRSLPEEMAAGGAGLSPAALARAVNHLGTGGAFRMIEDPAAYARSTRARLEAEDGAVPWREGVHRLRHHGVPDVTSVAPPQVADGRLVFFAEDSLLGAPCRVEVNLAGDAPSEADHVLLPMRPLPPEVPADPDPLFAGDTSPKPARVRPTTTEG